MCYYTDLWHTDINYFHVALGLGSIFNHSNWKQNVGFYRDEDNALLRYVALCDICVDEELFISYGCDSALWFESIEETSAQTLGNVGQEVGDEGAEEENDLALINIF